MRIGYRPSAIARVAKPAKLAKGGKLKPHDDPTRPSFSNRPLRVSVRGRGPGGSKSEGLVVRVAACLILTGLLCLGPTGCSLFKKNKDGDRPASAEGGRPPAQFPGSNDPLLNSSKVNPQPNLPAVAPSSSPAILAGRVIDGLNRPPTGTQVRCVNLDDKSIAPVDIPVSPEGYFTIQGLKPGAHYKLVTRGKSGDKSLASITYHTAPNIRVLIQVREDLASSPAPEGTANPPAKDKDPDQKPVDPPKTSSIQAPKDPPGTWVPGIANPASFNNNNNNQEPDLPGQILIPSSGAGGISEAPKQWPPMLQLPRPNPSLKIDQPPPFVPAPNEPRPEGGGTARVPSCVLVGKQLVNFALQDINGEPWEYRAHKKGKLVLVDFWGTWCGPCKDSMPLLGGLHNKYFSQGLEVIGIAYEKSGTPQEQAYRIRDVSKKTGAYYRQLLGGSNQCPVRGQFNVAGYPTIVLIDESGYIIWRHEGRLDAATQGELERLVQRRLNPKAGF